MCEVAKGCKGVIEKSSGSKIFRFYNQVAAVAAVSV